MLLKNMAEFDGGGLYCYWVGSLDFNFLDSPHISFQPAKGQTFCWGIYSASRKPVCEQKSLLWQAIWAETAFHWQLKSVLPFQSSRFLYPCWSSLIGRRECLTVARSHCTAFCDFGDADLTVRVGLGSLTHTVHIM